MDGLIGTPTDPAVGARMWCVGTVSLPRYPAHQLLCRPCRITRSEAEYVVVTLEQPWHGIHCFGVEHTELFETKEQAEAAAALLCLADPNLVPE